MDVQLDGDPVFFGPFFNDLDNVIDLRVRGVLEHLHDVDEGLPLLPPRDDHLKAFV